MRPLAALALALCLFGGPRAAFAQCDGDVNGDGTVGTTDIGIVSVCLRIPDGEHCPRADINDDGIVNCYDVGAWQCLSRGSSPDPACCVDPVCVCECSPYVTLGDTLDDEDIMRTEMCIGRDRTGSCEDADVNCDGVTDRCDVEWVRVQVEEGRADPLTCERVPCDRTADPDGGGGTRDAAGADAGEDVPGMVDCNCRTLPQPRATLPTLALALALFFAFRRRRF
jgi:MYXO-CTERM domain-containing protein